MATLFHQQRMKKQQSSQPQQQQIVYLPTTKSSQEMVSLPIGSGESTYLLSQQFQPSAVGGAQQFQQHQTTHQTQQYLHHNNMFSSNHQQQFTTVVGNVVGVTATGGQNNVGVVNSSNNIVGTTTQTRYFSQFSNNNNNHNHHNQQAHEIFSNLNTSTTTTLTTNNIQNRLQPHQQSSSLPAVSQFHQQQHVGYVKQDQHQQQQSLQEQPPNHNSSTNHQLTNNGNDTNKSAVGENGASSNDETGGGEALEEAKDAEPEPEIDIVINNVVCSFSVRCHLNLREIALNGFNVEFRRENGMVTMKLRRPYTTASIWSSGRITCTGATSEDQAKIAARRYARCLQKLGFRARFNNFRVVNVLGTCSMPWAIKIVNFSERYKREASYEPELHPGVTYKLRYPKATLKIFSTGSITVTAASVAYVQAAIEHIYPLVYEFRKNRTPEEMEILRAKQLRNQLERNASAGICVPEGIEEDDEDDDEEHSSSKPKRRRPNAKSDDEEEINNDLLAGTSKIDDIIYVSEYEDPDDLIEGPDDEDF